MKKNLLLLHGSLGSKKQFDALCGLLEEKFKLHRFNFEGHGGNSTEKEYSIELFTQNTKDYLRQHSISPINIFGYSMGGYVALKLSSLHPENISKIVTLGTKFNWDEASTSKEIGMLNPEKIEQKVPQFAEKLKEEHFPDDWKLVLNKTAAMMSAMASGARLSDQSLIQIKSKVIIGIGSDDKMVSILESQRVSNLIPNAKLEVLDGIPHPIDKVDQATLASFITRSFL